MNHSSRTFLTILLATSFYTGCTSTSVETRREKVPEFSISTAQVDPKAYQVPDVKWAGEPSNASEKITKYTGGGLVPAIIGAVIDSHAQKVDQKTQNEQQRVFEDAQAALLPVLNQRASQPPQTAIDAAVASAVRENRFLAKKVHVEANDVLEITITRFGLAKRGNTDESDPPMVAQILVTLKFRDRHATITNLGGYSGSSITPLPMSALFKDPTLIDRLYDQAAESLRTGLTGFFARKYGE